MVSVAQSEYHKTWFMSEQGQSFPQILGTNKIDITREHLSAWIFVIMHKREQITKLEYGNMGHNQEVDFRQVIIVCQSDFDNYRNMWGHSHVIISLPNESKNGVHVSHDCCGYAHNMIQHIAVSLKLEKIFYLDDNVILFIFILT